MPIFPATTPRAALIVGTALLALCPARASAWIYPEHREIGVHAGRQLPKDAQAYYQVLWDRARLGYSAGLCQAAIAADTPAAGSSQGRSPCIDLAAWPAIAGDHSCSPDELVERVLVSYWVHDVARVSEEVRVQLAESKSSEARENIWVTSNLALQEVDDDYVTRAGANNAHFLLSLAGDSVGEFIEHSTRRGAPLNALGLYVEYHAAALLLAAALGPDPSTAPAPQVRRLLALEAFALHFLQDSFASGHVAGSWGDDAVRKGTHDYYCKHGYAATSWDHQNLVLYGDAHMRPADLKRSAQAVADSLLQVVAAARGAGQPSAAPAVDPAIFAAAALDSCTRLEQPASVALPKDTRVALEGLLAQTPMPGYGPDSAAWPRYRADFGAFLGIASRVAGGAAIGGYGSSGTRAFGELAMGLRFGYGLEAVLASVNTGTMYLQVGITRPSEQIDACSQDCPKEGSLGSDGVPRVPSRWGLELQLRIPFWLIPGDLIVLAPILALASPAELTRVAIRAASGGLIPWQRTFTTPIGYVELVVGRVVGATFYGISSRVHTFTQVPPELDPNASDFFVAAGFRSVTLTFPVLEYTPFRTFAQTLTAAIRLQLAYAVDIPFDTILYAPEGVSSVPGPDWKPAHMVLLTLTVDARSYL